MEKVVIECPFCGQKTINAIYQPSILQSSTSSSAHKRITKFYQTKEKYDIQTGCQNCGKSLSEVKKNLSEGFQVLQRDKKILERLKQEGMPLEV